MTYVTDPFEKMLDQVIAPLTAYAGPAVASPPSALWALTDTGWRRVPAIDHIADRHDNMVEALHTLRVVIHAAGEVPYTSHEPLCGLHALAYLHRTVRDGVIVRTLELTDLQGCVYTRARHGDQPSTPPPHTPADRARHRALLRLAEEWADADDNPSPEPVPPAQRHRSQIDSLLLVRFIELQAGIAAGAGIRCLASAIALLAPAGDQPSGTDDPAAKQRPERDETIAGWLRDWVTDGHLRLTQAHDIAASLGVRLPDVYRVDVNLPLSWTVTATNAHEAADLARRTLPSLVADGHLHIDIDRATVRAVVPHR